MGLEQNDWQLAIEDLPDRVWDVVIVGAGPAGSVTAIYLARRGHQVLLIDQARFGREKPCGDAILADALRRLGAVGLADRVYELGHKINTATIFSPSRIEVDVPVACLTLRRSILDSLMARAATEAGAVFCRGRVQHIDTATDSTVSCSLAGHEQPLRARLAVLATGADIGLPHKLGMVSRNAPSGIAVRCYVRSTAKIDRMLFCHHRALIPGYGWVFPMGHDEYNVGCLVFYGQKRHADARIRELFDRFARSFPLARQVLQNARAVSPLRGAALRCGLNGARPTGRGNLLAVGEAIGTTFPSTGEGLAKAMQTGELAAEVIDDALRAGEPQRLHRFPARLHTELRPRYRGYQTAQSWLSQAWLIDLLVRRARRNASLRRALSGIADESWDPRRAFSLRAILKAFWT